MGRVAAPVPLHAAVKLASAELRRRSYDMTAHLSIVSAHWQANETTAPEQGKRRVAKSPAFPTRTEAVTLAGLASRASSPLGMYFPPPYFKLSPVHRS